MEFTYKKRALIIFAVMFLFGVSATVYELVFGTHLFEPEILFALILVLTGSTGVACYYNKLKAVIFVTDEGIGYKNKIERFIRWDEVTNVEVGYFSYLYFSWKESFIVKIQSINNEISVGSEIKNVAELIFFMKGKLGGEFDTKEIPAWFKYKQR
ncbi:hypothetical protein [Phosphitispora fastidiosa]|uniref:hypothetical protein n=1 Tax=Phosphitispora fastidiosa TaxID=2837202 RepID=UPI001E4484C1|nr:hypothetical protein [Phosphitispora fastidiosa]MBU7006897.1 hypothetical protein [Phosphitispora fastidiosa]